MRDEALHIHVAPGGGGDYATIGEAVQASPYDMETVVHIHPGLYEEKVFCEKRNITLLGAGRERTVMRWRDGAYQSHADGRKKGTFRSYTLFLGGECCRLEGMTVENAAGDGEIAGQGLALYADAASLWVKDAELIGCQDTLFCAPLPERERLPGGFLGPRMLCPRRFCRQYYQDCRVEGDIDFIFGGGDAVFENCEIISRDRGKVVNGYIAAPSGPKEGLGFVFLDCRFTSQAAPGTVYLGRPWRAYGKASLLGCYVGAHILPQGWDDWQQESNRRTAAFAEFGSWGPGASPTRRAAWSRQLTGEEAAALERRATELREQIRKEWR